MDQEPMMTVTLYACGNVKVLTKVFKDTNATVQRGII